MEQPKLASLEVLHQMVEEGEYQRLVWPDEGEFINNKWQFNQDHQDFEPLLIDVHTARLFVQAYEHFTYDSNKIKIRELIENNRGSFVFMFKKLWEIASFKRGI